MRTCQKCGKSFDGWETRYTLCRQCRTEKHMAAYEAAEGQPRRCKRCGKTLSDGDALYLNCPECREIMRIAKAEWVAKLKEAEKAADAERAIAEANKQKYSARVDRCKNCYWARLDGNIIFCPSPYGSCMKDAMREMWADARRIVQAERMAETTPVGCVYE